MVRVTDTDEVPGQGCVRSLLRLVQMGTEAGDGQVRLRAGGVDYMTSIRHSKESAPPAVVAATGGGCIQGRTAASSRDVVDEQCHGDGFGEVQPDHCRVFVACILGFCLFRGGCIQGSDDDDCQCGGGASAVGCAARCYASPPFSRSGWTFRCHHAVFGFPGGTGDRPDLDKGIAPGGEVNGASPKKFRPARARRSCSHGVVGRARQAHRAPSFLRCFTIFTFFRERY